MTDDTLMLMLSVVSSVLGGAMTYSIFYLSDLRRELAKAFLQMNPAEGSQVLSGSLITTMASCLSIGAWTAKSFANVSPAIRLLSSVPMSESSKAATILTSNIIVAANGFEYYKTKLPNTLTYAKEKVSSFYSTCIGFFSKPQVSAMQSDNKLTAASSV